MRPSASTRESESEPRKKYATSEYVGAYLAAGVIGDFSNALVRSIYIYICPGGNRGCAANKRGYIH